MLRTTTSAVFCGLILLTACGSAADTGNTLLQIQHDEELADSLANIIIQKEPLADEEAMRRFIEGQIVRAKESLAAAQANQRSGTSGPFVPMKENVEGWALLQDNILYLSSDFRSRPGVDLHLYLTTVVDPRDVAFPDITAVNVTRIDFPYGAMALQVPQHPAPEKLRTVVLWDATLKRLHGFAQLSKRQ